MSPFIFNLNLNSINLRLGVAVVVVIALLIQCQVMTEAAVPGVVGSGSRHVSEDHASALACSSPIRHAFRARALLLAPA